MTNDIPFYDESLEFNLLSSVRNNLICYIIVPRLFCVDLLSKHSRKQERELDKGQRQESFEAREL